MTEEALLKGKKAAYFTLGCKLNFAETSTVGRQLKALGVDPVEKGEKADICVVNTCTVTEVADKKCRQAIRKLIKEHPNAYVVVTGCYAQMSPKAVADIPGVDVVLGAEQKGDVLKHLDHFIKKSITEVYISELKDIHTFAHACDNGDRTRYFLKVQDGCNYFCTYCTIPYARGNSRNPSIASLVEEAQQAVLHGAKEIVLTGVNTGDFGRSTGETFLQLLQNLDAIEGVKRYRISSIEPNLLTEEIIQFVAQSRHFKDHFHIPLQSGCDETLQLMRRRYDTSLFKEKLDLIYQYMPDAFVGIDVIVGMNGETEEQFNQTYEYLKKLHYGQLHVFSYSERPGTKAVAFTPKTSPQQKQDRSHRLLNLSEEKRKAFYSSHKGKTMQVLLEKTKEDALMNGLTHNYIRVELEADHSLDNQLCEVELGEFNEDQSALMGKLIKVIS